MTNQEKEILALYSIWSEEYYCAGFLTPSPETVKEFRKWLDNPNEIWKKEPIHGYEREMLQEFHRQEQKESESIPS